MGTTLDTLRARARIMKTNVHAVMLAIGDPRVPWYAKAVAAAVVAYALSPIDLIPDFIPVLGYLDDLVLLPLGIRLAIRLMPVDVWEDLKSRADANAERGAGKWLGRIASVVIVILWIAIAVIVYRMVRR